MKDRIELLTEPFDPYAELLDFRESLGESKAIFGAEAHFIGSLRNHNEGFPVKSLWLEHYPGMTERELCRIALEERQRLDFGPLIILHRVGPLIPGEAIVLVALWSTHRAQSLEGTETIIDRLKHEAPFWKREERPEGPHWIAQNTPRRS